jgi:hypothetical protein
MQRCIFFILLLSSLLIACNENKTETAHTSTNASIMAHHEHGLLDISHFGDDILTPVIDLTVNEDAMTGWNIVINTENFLFAPEKVNTENTANEGHAHLYVDGFKFSRIYSQWFHLKALTPGEHTLRITLNYNDHSLVGHQGKEISAIANIIQN